MPTGEGRCCHCTRKVGDVFEEGESCEVCWIREFGTRRFVGVTLNRETKTDFTFEFEPSLPPCANAPSPGLHPATAERQKEFEWTSDREHGYAQRCDERATEHYAAL